MPTVESSPARARVNGSADSALSRISPEARLLALTSGGARNDAAIAELLAADLDSNALHRLALRERAAGPLVRHLRRVGGAAANAIADRLSQIARLSDMQALFLEGRLRRLEKALGERQIDMLLLKGAGLAHTLYASPLDRPMGDLDVMIPRERAAEATEVALSSGWVRRRDLPPENDYSAHQHLIPLEDDQDCYVGLEFHVELFSRQAPFVLPASEIMKSARPARTFGPRVWVADVHHQLLHVCLHFIWSHEARFGAWRTMRDIDVIVSSGQLDWRRFADIAIASRGATCCYWALRLARDLASTPVPDFVLRKLAPAGPAWLLDALTRHFAQISLPTREVCPSVKLSRTLWRMGVQPGMQGHGRSRPWFDVPGSLLQGADSEAPRKVPAAARLSEMTEYIVGLRSG